MMYSLSSQALPTVGNQRTRQAILRALAAVGQQVEPRIYAHYQPHAHATARLAKHFAAYVCGSGAGLGQLAEIEFGAHLHDIGKYFISSEILLKPRLLTDEERGIVSLHSVYGAVIVSKLPAVTETVRRIVLHHHERWDGTGYPEGLAGRAIPLAARIISVIDVYTSLRSKRSYKPSLSKPVALQEMARMAGRELDPALVEDFMSLYGGTDG